MLGWYNTCHKDLQNKSEKLHKDLERYMSSGNGTSVLEMHKGLVKYLDKYDNFGKSFDFQLEEASLSNIKKLPAELHRPTSKLYW